MKPNAVHNIGNRSTTLQALERVANEMRHDIFRMGMKTGLNGAHFGGGLSMVEIMAVLYMSVLRVSPLEPRWPERDRFILSKGHGAMAYYAALKQIGFVTDEELMSFKSNNTSLFGHPSMNPDIGIEFSTGSLGLGLALGVGTAIGLRQRSNDKSRVFVLLGDGECGEGSVWESAAAASHFGLSNLVVIIDKNGLQYDGPTKDVLNMDGMAEKWESFGWQTRTVNGHDVAELLYSFDNLGPQPTAIIANTVKGKGVSYMENNPLWHHARLTQSQFEELTAKIQKTNECFYSCQHPNVVYAWFGGHFWSSRSNSTRQKS
jgi:transketolase